MAKEQMFKKKYEKYTKILNRLTWLNACSSGISSVATFATFVGIPVSAALGVASMTGAIASGIISVLNKKYQKKLKKVTQTLQLETLNELTGVNHRMEAEHRSLVEKSLLEEINELKRAQGTRV